MRIFAAKIVGEVRPAFDRSGGSVADKLVLRVEVAVLFEGVAAEGQLVANGVVQVIRMEFKGESRRLFPVGQVARYAPSVGGIAAKKVIFVLVSAQIITSSVLKSE